MSERDAFLQQWEYYQKHRPIPDNAFSDAEAELKEETMQALIESNLLDIYNKGVHSITDKIIGILQIAREDCLGYFKDDFCDRRDGIIFAFDAIDHWLNRFNIKFNSESDYKVKIDKMDQELLITENTAFEKAIQE
jgi:hypothetical protein